MFSSKHLTMRIILICFAFGLSIAAPSLNDNKDDITYYFYSRSNRDGIAWKYSTTNSLPQEFDSKKETLIFIHGWLDKFSSASATLISTATLDTHDANFIVLDWSPLADSPNYLAAKDGVPNIGKSFGDFLLNLTSTYSVPPSKISIVGHSLGAHIAGIAGTILNGEIDHIVGLDPASPFIDPTNTDYVLDPTDAKFVQVIHTSGGKLGLKKTLGHADYYPNGGTDQPGCILDIFGDCAHKRAYKYFAESISDNKFYSESCSSYSEFSGGSCSGSKSLMGGYNVDKRASGTYFLKTNDDSPYAIGEISL